MNRELSPDAWRAGGGGGGGGGVVEEKQPHRTYRNSQNMKIIRNEEPRKNLLRMKRQLRFRLKADDHSSSMPVLWWFYY